MAILSIGCAEVGPPPGGEVDRTGPHLLESYPANGALGVETGYQIRLVFSETLTKPEHGGLIFISPRQPVAPQIKWKSNEVVINLAEGFQPDQTYIVSVSTAVTDLRRNRMDSAVTIAFSTGQSIDSGLVAGRVLTSDDKPAAGWIVGLYPSGLLSTYQLIDSVYPQYMTTASREGQFTLAFLPSTGYDLLAFEDKNRDELFNPSVEPFALPDREVTVGGTLKLDKLLMTGTLYDSLAPTIISVVATKDRLLRLRLGRKINPVFLAQHYSETTILSLSDSAAAPIACGGIAEAGPKSTDLVTAYFANLSDGIYQISLKYQGDLPPLVRDSVVFKTQTDDVPPLITSFLPGDKPIFVDQVNIALALSEPISREKLTDQTFILWAGEATTALRQTWTDPYHLALVPDRLAPGLSYRLDITEFDIRDLSGNALGDSLRSYNFATLDDDSVGYVSGQVVVSLPAKTGEKAVLTFEETESKRQFAVEIVAPQMSGTSSNRRDFSLAVPPGKYLLTGFLDANEDSKLTPGTIRPYDLSETRAVYADTIPVRARFETAGIEFIFE